MTTLRDYLVDFAKELIILEEDRQQGNDDRSRNEIIDDLTEEYLHYIVDRLVGQ